MLCLFGDKFHPGLHPGLWSKHFLYVYDIGAKLKLEEVKKYKQYWNILFVKLFWLNILFFVTIFISFFSDYNPRCRELMEILSRKWNKSLWKKKTEEKVYFGFCEEKKSSPKIGEKKVLRNLCPIRKK